jgi:hypothetical protein
MRLSGQTIARLAGNTTATDRLCRPLLQLLCISLGLLTLYLSFAIVKSFAQDFSRFPVLGRVWEVGGGSGFFVDGLEVFFGPHELVSNGVDLP